MAKTKEFIILMNQNQKILLLVVMIVFAAVLIYPPFEIIGRNGRVLTNGYAWIFDLPRLGRFLGAVNIPKLLIQCAGVLIIGGMLFFVLQDKGPAVGNKKIESRNDKTLEGVGGWLAFLIFSLLVLSPLFSLLPLGGIYGEEGLYPRLLNDPDWNALKTKAYAVIYIAVIFDIVAGWVLWRKREPDAVTFAITILWVSGPLASVILTLWAFDRGWGEAVKILIVTIPHAMIWTAYLRKSIRVRNTYSGESNLTPPQSSTLSQTQKLKPSEFVNENVSVAHFNNDAQLTDNNTNERVFSSSGNQHAPKMLSDDALYEMAWKETELNKGDRGLWAKAYAVCDGAMEKTRAYYIRERVRFLQEIQKKRIDEYKERKVDVAEENKGEDIEEKIRILRAYRREGSVDKCRKEARGILQNMGINYRNFIQNAKNITPLILAVGEGDKNKVELLLLAGADPVEKTTYGETASEKARKLKQDDIALLIDGYSLNRNIFSNDSEKQENDRSITTQTIGNRAETQESPTFPGNLLRKFLGLVAVIAFLVIVVSIIKVDGEPESAEEQFNRGFMYYQGGSVEQDYTEAAKWYRMSAVQGNADAQNYLGVMYSEGEGVEQNFTEALRWWRKAAEQGEAYAQSNLGGMYRTGIGVKQSDAEALSWYQMSAAQGNEVGQNNLGAMYANGAGAEQNKTEAVKWYLKAAEQGYAIAQKNLGYAYDEGEGVEKDDAEAVKWYRKAAVQGNADAQNYLGVMYSEGEGVEQNFTEALRWWRKAAEQGEAYAQSNLGGMYRTGIGVKQSDAEALSWYQMSAAQGDAMSQFNLGVMYEFGEGVEKNDAEAVKWYRKAADQGDAAAQSNLGVMYDEGRGVKQNFAESLKLYRQAAAQGDAGGQNNLGIMYKSGRGVEQNYAEAVKWYSKAAEQGLAVAQKNLGIAYDEGKGVEKNDAEAVKWYRKAAEQGNVGAQINLGLMYEYGEGVEKNYTEAVKWYRKAADANNETAQTNLALMYAKGQGVPQDDVKAAELFMSAAKQGESFAQFNLGLMAAKGRGVQKDTEKAINLYRQAAEQDHIVAQIYLAINDRDGLGMDKNESEKWFEAARKQNNEKLSENKRNVIPGGIESPPFMDNEALDWLRKAMEDETGMAYHRLSLMFKFGRGVIPDADEAEKWSRIAAKQGYKTHK